MGCIRSLHDPTFLSSLPRYLAEGDFDEVHFFGDKTFEGGNDHEIFVHPRVIGHTVTSPEDTVKQLEELFFR